MPCHVALRSAEAELASPSENRGAGLVQQHMSRTSFGGFPLCLIALGLHSFIWQTKLDRLDPLPFCGSIHSPPD